MKVLVTGGSGWIGRATCKVLADRGHEAVPFDRTQGGDVCDWLSVLNAVEQADQVIHLAGLLGTHELFDSPDEAIKVNVLGSANVTRACAQFDVGLTEITMPKVNPSLYAATKSCAMDIAEAYRQSHGLQVSYVRAYNAYGPGQAYGEGHPQKIIPTFATRAWAGEPLPIWGDGRLIVDLVHVEDVARMLVEAMPFVGGQVFDAGTGYAQEVIEVAWSVLNIVGKGHGGLEQLPPRLGERRRATERDSASGAGWDLLMGWRPVFDRERLRETVLSYQ